LGLEGEVSEAPYGYLRNVIAQRMGKKKCGPRAGEKVTGMLETKRREGTISMENKGEPDSGHKAGG